MLDVLQQQMHQDVPCQGLDEDASNEEGEFDLCFPFYVTKYDLGHERMMLRCKIGEREKREYVETLVAPRKI